MIWIPLTLAGAFCNATYNMAVKKMTETWSLYLIAASTFMLSAIILLIVSVVIGFPVLGNEFGIALVITGSINILATILYFHALKVSDLSVCVPMLSFTPLFLVITSFILLHEIPTVPGFLGIFLIIIGSYIITSPKNGCVRFSGLSELVRDRGIIYMTIVAFLYGIASVYDKILIQHSDAFLGSALKLLFIGAGFCIMAFKFDGAGKVFRSFGEPMALKVGIVRALEAVTINYSLLLTIVPYVISVKRLSIVMSVAYGGYVFGEHEIQRRLIGSLVMILGTLCIIL